MAGVGGKAPLFWPPDLCGTLVLRTSHAHNEPPLNDRLPMMKMQIRTETGSLAPRPPVCRNKRSKRAVPLEQRSEFHRHFVFKLSPMTEWNRYQQGSETHLLIPLDAREESKHRNRLCSRISCF
jgi:hypothetical protein